RAELARAGLESPLHLLAAAVLAPNDARALAAGAPLNTDDNMSVEFGAAAGSLVTQVVKPAIEARSSGFRGLPGSEGPLLWNESQIGVYADGLRRVGRDPARHVAQLRGAP